MMFKLVKHNLWFLINTGITFTALFAAAVGFTYFLSVGAPNIGAETIGTISNLFLTAVVLFFTCAVWFRAFFAFANKHTNVRCFYYTLPVSTAQLVLSQLIVSLAMGAFIIVLNVVFRAVQYNLHGVEPFIMGLFGSSIPAHRLADDITIMAFFALITLLFLPSEVIHGRRWRKFVIDMLMLVICGACLVYLFSLQSRLYTEYSHAWMAVFIALATLVPAALVTAAIYIIGRKRCV